MCCCLSGDGSKLRGYCLGYSVPFAKGQPKGCVFSARRPELGQHTQELVLILQQHTLGKGFATLCSLTVDLVTGQQPYSWEIPNCTCTSSFLRQKTAFYLLPFNTSRNRQVALLWLQYVNRNLTGTRKERESIWQKWVFHLEGIKWWCSGISSQEWYKSN